MLITQEYKKIQEEFHLQRPDYGMSGSRHSDFIAELSGRLNSRDILDYGCGKATLQKGIPFPIHNYDPCMPEYSKPPEPADIVVCTDVLEHIEPECIDEVIADLVRLTERILYLNVSCRPAAKFLPDGRNAHLIQETPNWWLAKLLPHMDMMSFQVNKSDFTAIFVPLEPIKVSE